MSAEVKAILTITVIVIFAAALVWGVEPVIKRYKDEAVLKQLEGCTYAGSRIERIRTVYMYDCDGVREETLRNLRD